MSTKLQKLKPGQPSFYEIDQSILKWWLDNNILEKSVEQRPTDKNKTFYDGPITANGMPHSGHLLTFSMKDLIPRYWTMKGFRVARSLGWDCQGIPVEYEVEKKLGFKEKKDIGKFGVAEFNKLCRESVLQYRGAMVDLERKIGRLTNDDEEYATMDADYIESVWWSLKELKNKGLLYEGFKVVPYSTRAGTTLSNAEVALGGYTKFVDPAVTVKFELVDEPGTFVLAWTTTPWTLPTNFALAIGEKIDYVKVEANGEKYIIAKECVKNYFPGDTKMVSVQREDLIRKKYKPLFNFFPDRANSYEVYYGFHVTTDSGTGVVHLAPYGVEDNDIFKEVGIESVDVLNEQGDYTDLVPDYAGMNYRDANPKIVEALKAKNLLFKYEDYEHDMPMCWRTNTPLIYKPITSWYVAMSTLREKLVNLNDTINWTPSHAKKGRFGNWLSEIKDWGISRLRYWGTPIPVWKSESGKTIVVGSFEELEMLSGVKVEDPHRPFIDEVEFDFEGEHYKRIPDVLDVWYDSGAMPFARFHYPFENKDKFENKFPAQFIAEGMDQTRGWFYTLHALSTALFDSVAFENVVVNGMIVDDKGAKLSKSKKNYTEPDKMIELFGADAIRINFFSTPILEGEDSTISDTTVRLTTQEVMLPLWNMYSYITTYADLHNWNPTDRLLTDYVNTDLKDRNVLDLWLFARLEETTKLVTDSLDVYEVQKAMSALRSLIDDMSKWFIRRSRDRFASNDVNALETLYYVYVTTLKLLAPFAPFLTEYLYNELVHKVLPDTKESIHLLDYPEADDKYLQEYGHLLDEMKVVRDVCSLGLKIRDDNRLKVRQPLSKALVVTKDPKVSKDTGLAEIIKDELNVKEVEFVNVYPKKTELTMSAEADLAVGLDTSISPELKEEGLLAELKRAVQNLRKNAGLKMGEVVQLSLETDNEDLKNVIESHKDELSKSLSASSVKVVSNLETESSAKVDGVDVKVKFNK